MLPGQLAQREVHHDVAKGEQIVAPTQFIAQMRINGDETRRANEVLPRAKLDMFIRLLIKNTASQTKVNHVDYGRHVANPHHDIVRFDIPMNHPLLMHELESLQDLAEEHKARLEGEFTAAKIEEVLQRRPQQFLNHENEVMFNDDSLVVQHGEAVAGQEFQILELHEKLRETTGN